VLHSSQFIRIFLATMDDEHEIGVGILGTKKAVIFTTLLSTCSVLLCSLSLPIFYNHVQRTRTNLLAEVQYCKVRFAYFKIGYLSKRVCN